MYKRHDEVHDIVSPDGLSGRDELAASLDSPTLRRRGLAGVFALMSWGLASLVISFAGSLVLARLLNPLVFGMVAIGLTLTTLVGVVAEGGIANGFIRRTSGVSHGALRSATAVQLITNSLLGAAIALAALPFGTVGQITAVMMASLPLASFQTGGRIVLIRELRFRFMSIAEATGAVAFYVWSIIGALLGFDVWALATGVVVRTAVVSAAIVGVTGVRLATPSLANIRDVFAVMGFGLKYSASSLADMVRDQGVNIVIGVIAGIEALGLWSLAVRIWQIPRLLFIPVSHVAFPAFSQLLGGDRDLTEVLERLLRLSLLAAALSLPAFTVVMPGLIPAVFGSQWEDTAEFFPGAMAGLFVVGPVLACCAPFLFAANRPGRVLGATLVGAAAGLLALWPLYVVGGLVGLGAAVSVGAICESAILVRATQQVLPFGFSHAFTRSLAISAAGVACGSVVLLTSETSVASALLAATAATAGGVLASLALARSTFADLARTGKRAVLAGVSSETRAPDPVPDASGSI